MPVFAPVNSVSQIGKWSTIYDSAQAEVAVLQDQLMIAASQPESDSKTNEVTLLRQRLLIKQLVMGLAKDFMEFWKERLKDFLALLKMASELASGTR